MPSDIYRLRMQIDRDPDELKYVKQEQQNQQDLSQSSEDSAGPSAMPPGPPAGPPQ
jgi:hypothetical protein